MRDPTLGDEDLEALGLMIFEKPCLSPKGGERTCGGEGLAEPDPLPGITSGSGEPSEAPST